MFPYHFGKSRARFVETEKRTYELMQAYDALDQCLELVVDDHDEAAEKVNEIIDALPGILEILKTDIQAGYEGDPAAKSMDEVIITYPAFYAIAIYRIAHKLYEMEIPMIPRIMTELAHQTTGIDIHPGAKIGRYFFIDHGRFQRAHDGYRCAVSGYSLGLAGSCRDSPDVCSTSCPCAIRAIQAIAWWGQRLR